jgi:ubiquinone/menaquinone biosynthesis C-methylase UbiE
LRSNKINFISGKASVKRMTVIDESPLCLQHAQQRALQQQEQQEQSWLHSDTSTLSSLPSASFDIVLSCM